jgi:hypothetical protein
MSPPTLRGTPTRYGDWRNGREPGSDRTCTPRPTSGSRKYWREPPALHSIFRLILIRPHGTLADAFEELDATSAWDAVVELGGGMRVPARLLALSRLL